MGGYTFDRLLPTLLVALHVSREDNWHPVYYPYEPLSWLYSLVGRRYAQWVSSVPSLFAGVIHKGSSFSFAEAECCVGEAASEACWEPCYCVLLQDEQTLTAYRSEDMAVSRFYRESLSDSPGFIHPSCFLSFFFLHAIFS